MVDIRELANKAQDRKTYYPALEFTPNEDKFAEGHAEVRFREMTFNIVENPKAKKGQPNEFLVIHVDLLKNSDFGQTPGIYQLQTAAANSSLTDGILNLWNNNNENLEGVVADIETYVYNHKVHGKTRGYRVVQLKQPKTSAPKLQQ